jgi:hypothetical protein
MSDFVQEKPFGNDSPYSNFLEGQKALIVLGNQRNDVGTIQLLTLGLSSLIEHYFRSVLSGAIFLCKESLNKALRSSHVSLAAANYYRGNDLGRAVFDSVNFSSVDIIVDMTSKYLSLNVGKKGEPEVAAALNDLQKVFIVRHAVVHANGYLSPKNLMELGLPHANPTIVAATYKAFENIVEVSLNSIQSYNIFLFNSLVRRAVNNSQLLLDSTANDIDQYSRYWKLFSGNDSIDRNLSIEESYERVKTYFFANR